MLLKIDDIFRSQIGLHEKKNGISAVLFYGGEGGRTPVRKPDAKSISERSLCFEIPLTGLPQTEFPLR